MVMRYVIMTLPIIFFAFVDWWIGERTRAREKMSECCQIKWDGGRRWIGGSLWDPPNKYDTGVVFGSLFFSLFCPLR